MAEHRFGRIACLLAAIALVLVLAGGCARKAQSPAQKAKPPPVTSAAVEVTKGPSGLTVPIARAQAMVPSYVVRPNLSNVTNAGMFKGILDSRQRRMVARNGFVVSPTKYLQPFQIYEENAYNRPKEIPSFITTDAMLHQYHIFYDYSLRKIETTKLYSRIESLTALMLKRSQDDYAKARDPKLKEAARGNVAYFALASSLLGHGKTPEYVAKEVRADLAKVEQHGGRAESDILSIGGPKLAIDFSQFVPRGHYTRSEPLKRYFKTMMWYGLTGLPLPEKKNDSPMPTLKAILVTRALAATGAGGGKSRNSMDLWQSVYEPTVFYVGAADDLSPVQYQKIMNKVYGAGASLEAFGDQAKLRTFIAAVEKLPGPRIANFVAGGSIATGKQMRFMGQRFILDSRILQELTHPKVDGRNFPRGLDVFATMGSERAYEILDKTYRDPTDFPSYKTELARMRKEVSGIPRSVWQSNLYYGWLWSLWPLTTPCGKGYPAFMRGEAWTDKSLNAALGSWAELRHDTILYAKQSVVECGGAEEELVQPKGYVEPNVELWSRLLWLTERTEKGLRTRGLLNEELAERFDWMSGWLQFLKAVSIKELSNKPLTHEEYEKIRYFGAELENQMKQLYEGDIISETDKNMAVIADVHTSFSTCLEEGVGHPAAIYVVVPIGGKLLLTRGAVFTYYEFKQPASNRLTDEAWQKMLKSGKDPGVPEWTRTFMQGGKTLTGEPSFDIVGGC